MTTLAKTINSKNWQLSAAWNGRYYSESGDVPAFTAPSSLTATPSGTTNALAWTNGTASAQTRVYRSTTESGTYSLITTVDAGVSSYDNTSLFEGTYWYKLEHVSANGSTSAQSAAVSGVIASGGATSGGTAAFAWSAPSGVADGNSITITSNTATFAQPTKQIYLGFGMGWLYSQADGTTLPASITVGSETIDRQGPNTSLQNRTVRTVNGLKTLYSLLKPGGASQPYSAVCLNWDTGAEVTPSDTMYAFRLSRLTIGNKLKEFQWKQVRFRPNANAGTSNPEGNEMYCSRGTGGDGYQRVLATLGAGGDEPYGTPLPTDGGGLSAFGIVWKPNTVDQTDGVVYTHLVDSTRKSFARRTPSSGTYGTPNDTIQSDSTLRPRFFVIQDDISNAGTSADFEIDTTDIYLKINGDLFLLADSSDLSTCTEPPIALVPTSFNSSQSWTFNLWKGAMSTYSGKYIHRLSALLEPLQVVAL